MANKSDEPKTASKPSEVVIPNPPGGKEETRLFQTTPGEKRWLTKDEAKKAGFYWKED